MICKISADMTEWKIRAEIFQKTLYGSLHAYCKDAGKNCDREVGLGMERTTVLQNGK